MADKKQKSRAEKAVESRSGKKPAPSKKNSEPAKAKKNDTVKKPEVIKEEKERKIPVRVVSSIVLCALFILTLVIFLRPSNSGGALLTFFQKLIYGLIGKAGFIAAIPALLYMFLIHATSGKRPVVMRTICLTFFIICVSCISHLWTHSDNFYRGINTVIDLYRDGMSGISGGLIGGLITILIQWLCGNVVTYILLFIAALLTLLAGMNITIPSIVRAIQNRPRAQWEEEETPRPEPAAVVVNHIAQKRIAHKERKMFKEEQVHIDDLPAERDAKQETSDMMKQISADLDTPVAAAQDLPPVLVADEPEFFDVPPAEEPVVEKIPELKPEMVKKKDALEAKEAIEEEIAEAEAQPKPAYCFPPIDLLKLPVSGGGDGSLEMRENSRRLNETLASFKIEAHIINVTRGPSVTRYEVELEKGVRLSKLTTAADDIALSLGAVGVRIAAIPGKISVVGIEVPNKAVNTVSLREVIDSQEFDKAKSKAAFAVGKDIGGNCIVGNIARLPHMLIAGTTGSGKSVCMNSIIISLLYKASPDDVKLIMVDPKMVELGIYNGIPHLLIPVVTDPKKAAGSLQWAVTEMMRRYKAMSDAGVRDLDSYNSIIESQEVEGKKMPKVVVIIDELADLMLVAAKEVEESICRIAQMGRAAGIHLIIATQRPSADVITGLMKANIPSRIAFAVASAMESRIILDTMGAEKLVGKGDMLYAPIGDGKPKRVQGCFVSDPEVEAVANYVKSNFTTDYDQTVMEEIERKAMQSGNKVTASEPEPSEAELDGDEMLPAAVDVILETGQASVSMLQRRLKLGYSRAARIVDEMEERGIVGPFQGSKPRAILVTKEQWEMMKSGQTAQMGFDDLEAADTEDDLPF